MECPVCWEPMGSAGMATVSIPCGHLFHQACLTQAMQPVAPECPLCRSLIHELEPPDFARIPPDLRPYVHSALRPVYASVPDNESTVLRKELDHLYTRLETFQMSLQAAKQRETTADGRVAAIMDLWKKEQARNMELQKALAEKTSAERQRRADEASACLKIPCHAPPMQAPGPSAEGTQRSVILEPPRSTSSHATQAWGRPNTQTPVTAQQQHPSAAHASSPPLMLPAMGWGPVTEDLPLQMGLAGSSRYGASTTTAHPSQSGNEASAQQELFQPAAGHPYPSPSPRPTAVAYAVPRLSDEASSAYHLSLSQQYQMMQAQQMHHSSQPPTQHMYRPLQQAHYSPHQQSGGHHASTNQQQQRQRSLTGDARERQMMAIRMQQQRQALLHQQRLQQAAYAQAAGSSQWGPGPSV